MVAVREVQALKNACATIDPSYKPKITYVICAKRHHIRYFLEVKVVIRVAMLLLEMLCTIPLVRSHLFI